MSIPYITKRHEKSRDERGIMVRNRVVFLLLIAVIVGVGFQGCSEKKALDEKEEAFIRVKAMETQLNRPLPDDERKRILILHSYHKEFQWIDDVNSGIMKALLEERFDPKRNIRVENFFMDTKRKTDEEWKLQIGAEAMDRIEKLKPDVVFAVDDNAQNYVVKKMANSGTPFVFLGVNADPMKYGYIKSMKKPGGNVTGCIERTRFAQTVDLLRKIVPGVRKLAVLCDDGPSGKMLLERLMKNADNVDIDIVAVKHTDSFREWKRFIREIQTRADALLIIVYYTVKDDNGEHVHQDKVLKWIIENNKLPDIGFFSWKIEGGLLCSEAISGFQQGYYAGTMAAYILRGQSPGELPVGMPQRGEICINLARAEMLGIEIPNELTHTATLYRKIGVADN